MKIYLTKQFLPIVIFMYVTHMCSILIFDYLDTAFYLRMILLFILFILWDSLLKNYLKDRKVDDSIQTIIPVAIVIITSHIITWVIGTVLGLQ